MPDFAEIIAESIRTPDEADGRVYGWLPGVCLNRDDPKSLGRIQARIIGQQATDSTDWLIPAWPAGIEARPRVGDPILIAFIDGDPNRGIWMWTVKTTSTGRCIEAAALGTSLVSVLNNVITTLNALITVFDNHAHQGVQPGVGNTLTYVTVGPGSVTPPSLAAFALAADGSKPLASNVDTVVLSADVKVR